MPGDSDLMQPGWRESTRTINGLTLHIVEAAYTLDTLAADVVAVADAVGASRFHLIGHDRRGQPLAAPRTARAHQPALHRLSSARRMSPTGFSLVSTQLIVQGDRVRRSRRK